MRVSKGQEDVTFSAKDQQAADERLADTTDGFEATSPAAVRSKKEAGKRPALPMNDKVDLASAELVEDTLGDTSLLAGMLAGVAAKAAAPKAPAFDKNDSKVVHPRRFTIVTDAKRDALLTDFGKETLDDRYLLPGETYQDLFARVADAYADDQDHAQRLYDYISRLWFMPATPVLSNGGTGRGLPISCYLNTVEDSLEGIVNTWNENVWLASRGGGIGTYWGKVRGIGESVGLNGKTSGIIPFVRVMDSLTLAISQGSLRRGSAACYLDVSHPEIEEFLEIRKTSGDFNRKALNLHHGVLLTDDFMRAVRDGEDFNLKSPKDGSVRGTVNARALFQKLVEVRLATGEPYLVFSDTVNRMMPKHHRDLGLKVYTSNLCSEITLPTGRDHLGNDRTAVCCLSSLNLETWDEWNGDKVFIEDVMRFLDNVLQDYIDRAPDEMARAKYSAARERSVGMGVMGYHSFLQKKGIAFESAMAKAWNLKMFKHVSAKADEASIVLAQERGACPDAADMGVMQRFLQDGHRADRLDQHHLRRHLGLHRADPGEHLHPQDAVGQLRGEEPLSAEAAGRQEQGFHQCVELDPGAWRFGAAARLPDGGREGGLQDQLRDRSALAAGIRRRPHALYRPGPVAEPLHPLGCGQVGSDDAALSGVGEGHQVALLSAFQVDPARRFRGRGRGGQHLRRAAHRAGSSGRNGL
jgi:ribonucleoside-diphosphate reductase alpha chain